MPAFKTPHGSMLPLSPPWLILIFMGLTDLLGALLGGFTLDWQSTAVNAIYIAGLTILTVFYRFVRRDKRIWELLQSFLQIILNASVLVTLTYLSIGLGGTLTDKQLIAVDQALGFDWRAHIAWFARHPWLNDWLSPIYLSMLPQIGLTIILLTWLKNYTELHRFVTAFMLMGIFCVIGATLFPAVGGYVFYDVRAEQLPIMPGTARVHEAHLMALRAGQMHTLLIAGAQGLVTFPSFHVATGVLFAYTARVARFFFPLSFVWNALMIFSVFSQGGHYLIDAIGGAAMAAAGIIIARAWVHEKD